MYFVYVLRDFETDEVFYIGYTNNLERRKQQHLSGHNVGDSDHEFARACSNRVCDAKQVNIDIVGKYQTQKEAREYARDLMYYYADMNYPLINDAYYLSRKRWNIKDLERIFTKTLWYQRHISKI